ncbi:MAG TPA: GlxA family transcriptional regulator [Microbacteriaceae bacterium]|nr:GlxA family transcriptional regulator [Microbacteriaceae bacterium]
MTRNQTPTAPVRRIAFLVFDGVKLLDVSGPSEVFAEANRLGAHYELTFTSPDGADVTSSIGIRFPVHSRTDQLSKDRVDTVVISGGDVFPAEHVPVELIAAVRDIASHTRRLASICTGAFVLAASGLLEGKRATTHWQHVKELARRYPGLAVDPDAIFVKDGNTYTSAGVSSGIDLALALVEEDYGPELTRRVAQSLVVYMQRSGGQSQFSASLQGPPPKSSALREVVDLVKADPAGSYSVPKLALRARVSARHLTRLFAEEMETTPAKYIELIRFDAAKAMLDAGRTVTETAELSGFGNSETLRRAFISHLGVAPSKYQQRFRSTLTPDPTEPAVSMVEIGMS